jgi:hypothetical protein
MNGPLFLILAVVAFVVAVVLETVHQAHVATIAAYVGLALFAASHGWERRIP